MTREEEQHDHRADRLLLLLSAEAEDRTKRELHPVRVDPAANDGELVRRRPFEVESAEEDGVERRRKGGEEVLRLDRAGQLRLFFYELAFAELELEAGEGREAVQGGEYEGKELGELIGRGRLNDEAGEVGASRQELDEENLVAVGIDAAGT